VLEVLSSDFVRTARAKGVAPRAILVRHVLRAALVPVVTLIGMDIGTLLGGTVLVEYVFNWPGLSAPLMRSIGARDYPMVAGIVLITSALFLALNVATDILNAAIDPRAKAR
jgi:peptide/nickel transport system permease protein